MDTDKELKTALHIIAGLCCEYGLGGDIVDEEGRMFLERHGVEQVKDAEHYQQLPDADLVKS